MDGGRAGVLAFRRNSYVIHEFDRRGGMYFVFPIPISGKQATPGKDDVPIDITLILFWIWAIFIKTRNEVSCFLAIQVFK